MFVTFGVQIFQVPEMGSLVSVRGIDIEASLNEFSFPSDEEATNG
jgi:hypothetical protein